jgi:hypothetical protein
VTSGRGASPSAFGTLARFEVGESLEVQFVLLPSGDAARPLWRPFSAGALAALLLDTSEGAVRLGRFFAWETRVPVAVLGGVLPIELEGAPAGAVAVRESLSDALRTVLVQNLLPGTPASAA